MLDRQGRALISGGSSGIGLACAAWLVVRPRTVAALDGWLFPHPVHAVDHDETLDREGNPA